MYLHKYIYTCIFVFVGISALLDYYGFYKYMTIYIYVCIIVDPYCIYSFLNQHHAFTPRRPYPWARSG